MDGYQALLTDLSSMGLKNLNQIYRNLSLPSLYEEAVRRREGSISHRGPFVVRTGQYTGRSPNDKFIVREKSSEEYVWWGDVNKDITEEKFNNLFLRLSAYWQGKEMFVQDCYAGADPKYRIALRVLTEDAWHSMFARDMFIRITDNEELMAHKPDFTVINAPRFTADPSVDGTNSEAFVIVHFGRRLVIIGGTSYAGEIKKSIFTVMNYLMPRQSVLSMHCSANIGPKDDVAIFFGLSGTGKTTLSADPSRKLIGDDEHGWSDDGVFNFEGGCYAKVIRLSKEAEPQIFENTEKFGVILENVAMDYTSRRVDLNDSTLTENTRAAYPITEIHVPNAELSGKGGHPKNIFMLTADAFGVLPPLSKLTNDQAMFHFLSGYTAKVAGTERGVTEPKATFSTCFGAPFLALHPTVYASLLGKKIASHKVNCWLVNTGWTGGPHGVGSRMKIQHTRAMLHAALEGKLDNVEYEADPVFGVLVPKSVPGVPSEVLVPKNTWSDKGAYDAKAKELATLFRNNFKKYESEASDGVKAAAPKA
ncbi:MAG: phosphoenolpyruvate carboxykinase (ATP) [Nitrospinae bacterium]|nr:phosphoenolpyruvate carboxykinase (ATP) [Nitrospinota bacterium]